MNSLLKKIFETFTILTIGWDYEYGFSLSILETYQENKKSTNMDNCLISRALFRICINSKRINYSFLFFKLKTKYFK